MPPRKSNVSTVSNGGEEGTESTPARSKDGISVEDLSLPKSMIARLAKGVLPANTQIHKDALLALHKSATVFVSYIASNANENAQAGGKKTILPPDVMSALKDAEFEEFLPRLEAELKKYNDTQCDKRNTYRRRVKEEKTAVPVPEDGEEPAQEAASLPKVNGTVNGHAEEDDASRPAKKLKGDSGVAVAPEADGAEEEDADEGEEDDNVDADEDEVDDEDEDGEDEAEAEDDEGPVEGAGGGYSNGEVGWGRDEALDDPDSE